MSEKHAEDPIIFVAVNSGNPKSDVAAYVAQHQVPWAVIVDPDREFEKLCGLKKEISLRNITQVRYISGDGVLKNGRWDDVEGTIEKALQDATWRIDPRTMPDSLKSAWSFVEQGNYQPAAKDIQSSLTSRKEEVRVAAQSLAELVKKDLKKRGRAAWQLGKEGKRWEAYQALESVCEDFAGFDIPNKLVQTRDKLAGMDAIKNEIRAKKMLSGTKEMLMSGDPRKERAARKRLTSLIKKFPDSTAAEIAKSRLEEVSGS